MDSNTASRQAGLNLQTEMARRRPRLSQRMIGEHLGISQAAVSAKMLGKTPFTLEQLVSIADLLDVPLEVLTDGVAA